MDADDLMLPERVEAHLDHFNRNPSLALSATQVRLFPEQGQTEVMKEYVRWQNEVLTPDQLMNEIYVESPFAHPAVAFRRKLVLSLGGYLEGDFPEDYELWLRIQRMGFRMEKIPQVALLWRDGADRLSRNDPRHAREALDRLRARHLALDPRLRGHSRPLVFWSAGLRTRGRAAFLISEGFQPTAWVDVDPRKIGNRIDGIPVVPPEALRLIPAPSSWSMTPITAPGRRSADD